MHSMDCVSYLSVAVVKYHDQKQFFGLIVLEGESEMSGRGLVAGCSSRLRDHIKPQICRVKNTL